MTNWEAIILAGGSGNRMGAPVNKVLLSVGGIPVILRSLLAIQPWVQRIILVIRPQDASQMQNIIQMNAIKVPTTLVDGGASRQESVRNGLLALNQCCDHVLIHDGARCFVDAGTIQRAMQSAEQTGNGIAAMPVTDTVKRGNPNGIVLETLDRSFLYTIQTPQCFQRNIILAAHERARIDHFSGTDDASLLEHAGMAVYMTKGSSLNIKLTTPEDLSMGESIARQQDSSRILRIGHGFDVHRLVENRKLILCGVEIPFELGLDGHSDADVALHALMDAMLGAIALGDIGKHFPDSDPAYCGISSIQLLKHVNALLAEHHTQVVNADITIIAQKPKLAPFIDVMRERVANAIGIPVEMVSVKATTTERLGFEGRMEGISAQAVVMTKT